MAGSSTNVILSEQLMRCNLGCFILYNRCMGSATNYHFNLFHAELKPLIQHWSKELGFADCGFSNSDLSHYIPRLQHWLEQGYHGDMNWILNSVEQRKKPSNLVPDTISIISLRMNYLGDNEQPLKLLDNPDKAYISRYALGRDYHKLMRKRIAVLGQRIKDYLANNRHHQAVLQRPFVDSAPVLEKPLAEKAGLGWIGKNTLLLNKQQGSWFFLGELYTNVMLEPDSPEPSTETNHCGKCRACISVCPTNAFPKPYVLDARRCISYLTIEYKGIIEESLRNQMGNRVFGCDDCQLVCPWNRYAAHAQEDDFKPRHQLNDSTLLALFNWSEQDYLDKTAGSAIRRSGYESWQRNLAIGLGNGNASSEAIAALTAKKESSNPIVAEHVNWALNKLQNRHG